MGDYLSVNQAGDEWSWSEEAGAVEGNTPWRRDSHAVEFNDMKSGFWLRTLDNELYVDIYLYDSLSSGAGYTNRVSQYIEEILTKMNDILLDCDCENACLNCLQHFGNQKYKENLDRFLGLDFLDFVWFGHLKTKIDKKEEEKLNNIAHFHGIDKTIIEYDGKYYIQGHQNTIQLLFYSSMCYYDKSDNRIIYISDRMCKYTISGVWKDI